MESIDKVSIDKEYEFVSSQVQEYNRRIADAFKLFVQLFSLIVGGSVWLSIQNQNTLSKSGGYARLSDILVVLVAVYCAFSIWENLRAWRGYRFAQSRLGGLDEKGNPRIPPPQTFKAASEEAGMMITILIAAVLFCFFNPFAISPLIDARACLD
jgi:hypothetical protein